MPSAAGGVIDRSVGHSAFRILPTVPQPTFADFIPQITFRIPHFRKLASTVGDRGQVTISICNQPPRSTQPSIPPG